MKKSEIESGLRQCFSENTVPDAVRGGREKLILTARQTSVSYTHLMKVFS